MLWIEIASYTKALEGFALKKRFLKNNLQNWMKMQLSSFKFHFPAFQGYLIEINYDKLDMNFFVKLTDTLKNFPPPPLGN